MNQIEEDKISGGGKNWIHNDKTEDNKCSPRTAKDCGGRVKKSQSRKAFKKESVGQ